MNVDTTVQTNLINPAAIPHLTAADIKRRTWGSKTVLLVEQCMCATQWGTKACLLILYWRITQNLTQHLAVKFTAIYCVLTYILMEILYFGYWCRPFHDYWQTPTKNVQCTTALHHLILNLSFNLSSDLLIMSIPLPLLIKAHLPLKKKLLLVFPFTLGIFTITCAILSKHLTFTQPFSGYWVYWYCRESSTAMIVSNMPYSWTLIRRIFNLKSFFDESGASLTEPVPLSIQGISMRAMSVTAETGRSKNRSSTQFLGRQSVSTAFGSISAPSMKRDLQMAAWRDHLPSLDGGTTVKLPIPSSSGSDGGLIKHSASSDTTNALDKLYPLEDDDAEEDNDKIEVSSSSKATSSAIDKLYPLEDEDEEDDNLEIASFKDSAACFDEKEGEGNGLPT